jgi:biopolymer transport protein ExbD
MFARPPLEEPRIEISSLVDVVFLLLIFFMVTTTFAERSVVEVTLPSAEGESREVESQVPSFVVDAAGVFYLEGEAVDKKDIRDALEARFEGLEGEDRALSGRIDDQTPFGVAAELFDACGKLGILQVLTETRPEPSAKESQP